MCSCNKGVRVSRETIEEWLNTDHRRTVYGFSIEFNMDISEVWKILDGGKK